MISKTYKEPFTKRQIIYDLFCDVCSSPYSLKKGVRNLRLKQTIANGRDICFECTKKESHKRLAAAGKKALSSLSHERRVDIARQAGLIGGNVPNSGRFTTERWDAKTPEQQKNQVTKANEALQEKLKDTNFRDAHYKKILKGRIGYMSRGQQELLEALSPFGFKGNVIIDAFEADACHVDKRIIVEYNGDAFHCNPQKYNSDFYSTLIRMTAGEKWKKDRCRTAILKKRGYTVLVVWESDWKENKQACLHNLYKIINETKK